MIQMLSIPQHTLLFRTRRGLAVALAVAEMYGRQTDLESLQSRNAGAPLQGEEAERFKRLLAASSYVAAFSFAAYILQTVDGESEPANDTEEPDFLFDTPQDALKSLIAGLDTAIAGAPDDVAMMARARALARVAIEGLISRRGRFEALSAFAQTHLRDLRATISRLTVSMWRPGQRRKPLVMSFKKPNEIIGNHLAKHQAMRLARMIVCL
jgi:hypothetical protein